MGGIRYVYPNKRRFVGKILDNYLAKGFYRMHHSLHNLNYIIIGLKGMPVFWLRLRVADLDESGTAKSIRKDCKTFMVTYKPAVINKEINALFRVYRKMIDFETSLSCTSYLHSDQFELPFNSMMIEIRDVDRLIAVGYFDKGTNAIAAILHFYHPDYKKYSLGKYLILKEIDYAAENKISLYYSGYIAINFPKFDYKLFPDINAIEVFLPIEKEWKPYKQYDKVYLEKYFTEHVGKLF